MKRPTRGGSLRRLAGAARARTRTGPTEQRPWVVAEDDPPAPETLDGFRLFAVAGTWFEGDVVAATVRNALAQGCEAVYLVDNDSPDDTVEQAVGAGARLAATYTTDSFDDVARMSLMQQVMDEVSAETGDRHVWWLWLDADEFPRGPRGLSIREMLATLDRRFRVVGTRYFNHVPDELPEYVRPFHPIDFQPQCEETRPASFCSLGCRKHPLRRWDRDRPRIVSVESFHDARSDERPLREPTTRLLTHHFPFREQAATRARLDALCGKDGFGTARNDANDARVWSGVSGITRRYQNLDAVYSRDWASVRLRRRPEEARVGMSPVPWHELVGEEDRAVPRWYGARELAAALAGAEGA